MTKAEIFDYALMTIGLPLLGVLGAGLRYALKWLAAKTATTIDDAVLPKLGQLADVAVKSVYQEYVKPLHAAGPGAWTPEAHAEAKRRALVALKSYLGAQGLKQLAGSLSGDAEKFLADAVEAAVHDNKRSGEIAKAAANPI